MRIVIQRVNHASVKVDGETIGSIGKGYLLLLGVAQGDTKEMVDRYVKKLSTLRIFADKEGKTNLSITDVGGEVLVVSQFTLYADCKKGNQALSRRVRRTLQRRCMSISKQNAWRRSGK